jgi:hypothetical protein
MIFRASIAVLCAAPSRPLGPDASMAVWRRQHFEIVALMFGINARNLSEAVTLAVDAGQHAFNRKGEYIGGVVLETNAQCVNPEEFESYRKYFHRPMDEPGVFYVSGTHGWTLPRWAVLGALEELEAAAKQLDRFGLPAPSLTQPQLPDEPPRRVRLLCTVCGHWTEVQSQGVVLSFIPEEQFFTDLSPQARKSRERARAFFQRHGIVSCRGTILAVHEADARWATLNSFEQEADDAPSL